VPADVSLPAWGWGQTALIDRDARWWYPTAQGLARYPAGVAFEALATTLPELFVRPDRLPGRDVFRLYEDRRGDVWISTMSANGLARWDRATEQIAQVDGLPHGVAMAFAEDTTGALWVSYSEGQLARIAAGAPPHALGPDDGLPPGEITALLIDRAGRLWAGHGSAGVTRIDDPGAAHPSMRRFTVADGLGTDQVVSLIDDTYGRIYIGTSRGLDRLDPETGHITHFDTADGLPNDYINVAHRDRTGALWFGTKAGAARLIPTAAAQPPAPPATYISRIAIAGTSQAIAVDGARHVALEIGPDDGQLDIAFTSPSFAVGERMRFQYRLDGDPAWSTPVAEREVHLAGLAAGSYRFLVRAVSSSGATSEPATVAFEVLPHVWRRGWFLALCAAAIGFAVHRVYRIRLRHALLIERVRTRIATDLHDELGANLSRIAILAEVANRRAAADQPLAQEVDDIGRSARELVDVAADIVWSTDPRRDDLGSVIVRLRRFAGDVLEGRGMTWSLEAPPDPARIKLGPDQRRHLHLIVKEAIHNAAKHSEARHVAISIARTEGGLDVRVSDDGNGMSSSASRSRDGNGLANMRARAAEAGGTLAVDTGVGRGTTIALRLRPQP
jgi:signal transduction histidine kinase/sugar lactone lactonase YvrE